MGDDGDDPTLPRAGLNKLIKDSVPHLRCSNETRDLLYNCCIEFIRLVSTRANDLCNAEQKKTVSHEHVLRALDNLGFGAEYVEAAGSVMSNCREAAARRLQRQNSRLENLGIPEEELLRKQQELFQKARDDQRLAEELQLAQFQQLFAAAQQQQTSQNGSVGVSADDDVTTDTTTTSTPSQSASAKSAPDNLDEDYDA